MGNGCNNISRIITNANDMNCISVKIYRGDDSNAFGRELRFSILDGSDYSGCYGIFTFCDMEMQVKIQKENYFTITLTAEESKQLPLGKWDARLKLFDRKGLGKTLWQKWQIEVLKEVCSGTVTIDGTSGLLGTAVCGMAILGKEQ